MAALDSKTIQRARSTSRYNRAAIKDDRKRVASSAVPVRIERP
jgi:hypothetical protein